MVNKFRSLEGDKELKLTQACTECKVISQPCFFFFVLRKEGTVERKVGKRKEKRWAVKSSSGNGADVAWIHLAQNMDQC